MWQTLKLDEPFRLPEVNTGPLIYAVLQLRNLYGTDLELGEGSVVADGKMEKIWKEKGSSLSKAWIGGCSPKETIAAVSAEDKGIWN